MADPAARDDGVVSGREGVGAAGGDEAPEGPLTSVRRATLEEVLHTVRRLGATATLQEALDEISQAVCDVLGFETAIINVTRPAGDLLVAAAVGAIPDGFIGSSIALATWDEILGSCEAWGALRFRSHELDQSIIASVPHVRRADQGETPPGHWHQDDALFAPLLGEGGELVGVISVDQPTSRRLPDTEQCTILELFALQASSAILDANRRARIGDEELLYRTAFARTPAPTVILDAGLGVLAANQAVARLLVRSVAKLETTALPALVDPLDLEAVERACREVLAGSPVEASVEHRLRRADGAIAWARTRIVRVDSAFGGNRLVLTLRDVTEARRTIEELLDRADHDRVTGLPGRAALQERLRSALDRCGPGQLVAVLVAEVDGRATASGHRDRGAERSDDRGVAQRLRGAIRPSDGLCRLAPDQYVVVALLDTSRVGAVGAIAERCVAAVREGPGSREPVPGVTVSIGAVFTADGRLEPADLLAAAGVAVHEAAAAGGDRWHLGRMGDPRR